MLELTVHSSVATRLAAMVARIIAVVLVASVAVVQSPHPAAAATGTVYFRGSVTCPEGYPFAGAWVNSSSGKSNWANKTILPGTSGRHARIGLTLSSVTLPTKIKINVGCGTDGSQWKEGVQRPRRRHGHRHRHRLHQRGLHDVLVLEGAAWVRREHHDEPRRRVDRLHPVRQGVVACDQQGWGRVTARSRDRASTKALRHGQSAGRCSVSRRAERVIRPGSVTRSAQAEPQRGGRSTARPPHLPAPRCRSPSCQRTDHSARSAFQPSCLRQGRRGSAERMRCASSTRSSRHPTHALPHVHAVTVRVAAAVRP